MPGMIKPVVLYGKAIVENQAKVWDSPMNAVPCTMGYLLFHEARDLYLQFQGMPLSDVVGLHFDTDTGSGMVFDLADAIKEDNKDPEQAQLNNSSTIAQSLGTVHIRTEGNVDILHRLSTVKIITKQDNYCLQTPPILSWVYSPGLAIKLGGPPAPVGSAVFWMLGKVFIDLANPKDKTHRSAPAEISLLREECWRCGAKGGVKALMKCGACHQAKYCGKECQKGDWKKHKWNCESLKEYKGKVCGDARQAGKESENSAVGGDGVAKSKDQVSHGHGNV